MKEGMWYKIIDPVRAPNYPDGLEVKLRVGDFWFFARDDGSTMPWFDPVSGAGCFLKKDRFDPTPYIRKADGRFVPEKEDSMIEGKFYRCIKDNLHTRKGDFCKLLINDGSAAFKYQTRLGPKWVHNSCFDLTRPYDTPPKKENTMIEGKWYKCIESGSGVEAGRYYQCVVDRGRISTWGNGVGAFNHRFDPTPHDKTVFPNAPDLIERVRRNDPAAAEWLEFGDHSEVANFDVGKCDLDKMMIWSSTPQGHNYWERLHDAVDYEEEETPVTETFLKGERVEVRDDEDEDWEPAVFLCMDEEADGGFKYVVRNMHDCLDGFKFCRRPMTAPARPRIEPGTPIEVWDDEGEKPELRRFSKWISSSGPYVVSTGGVGWKHCRVLVPNGVGV